MYHLLASLRQLSAAVAVGLAIVTLLFASPAAAGACQDTVRSGNANKADLRIYNKTRGAIVIRFYEGGGTPDKLQKTVTVGAGGEGHHAFTVARAGSVVGIAKIDIGVAASTATCSFKVANRSGASRTQWVSGSCDLSGAAEACPSCTDSCDKSWDYEKNRWRTKYTMKQ